MRLVVARTDCTRHVDSGGDASKLRKEFFVREDLVGRVYEWDGDRYVIRFTKA